MAKLDWVEILKYDSRQVIFYEMLMNKDPFTVAFDKGSTQPIADSFCIEKLFYKSGSNMTEISLTSTDSQILGKIQTYGTNIFMSGKLNDKARKAWDETDKEPGEDANLLKLKRLYKDGKFKDGKTEFNRGDVAEGIQSAALVARFMKEKPNMTVTKADVEAVIAKLGKYNGINEFTIKDQFTSPNLAIDPDVPIKPDKIIYKVGLAAPHMKAFLSGRVRATKMSGIYDAAVNYANSNPVKEWDKEFYENGRRDIITVSAQGLEDQKGTKKDIDVSFTDIDGKGKKVSMEISVKVAGVAQFSQRGGSKFDTLQTLMGEFYFGDFGRKSTCLSQIKQQYRKLTGEDIPADVPEALRLAYKVGYDKMGGGSVISWNKNSKESFAKATKWHAQKEQGEVPVLNLLEGGGMKYYDYNKLWDALEPYDYISITDKEYTSTSAGTVQLPTHVINIHKDKNSPALPILRLRVKVETQNKPTGKKIYYRSVIESESKTGILVGAEDIL